MGRTVRKFNPSFKLKVCQEIDSGIKTRTEIIREYGLVESVVAKWVAKFRSFGSEAFTDKSTEIYHLKKHISDLEKSLGKKTLEVEILQETLKSVSLKRGNYTNS